VGQERACATRGVGADQNVGAVAVGVRITSAAKLSTSMCLLGPELAFPLQQHGQRFMSVIANANSG